MRYALAVGSMMLVTACANPPRSPVESRLCTTCTDDTDEAPEDSDTDATDADADEQPATGFELRQRVLQDETYAIEVALNTDTVRCSSADYGGLFLKILIPDVAKVTLFDHRNEGVEAPCIAAGLCTEELGVETIVNDDPSDSVSLRVLLTADYSIDHDGQTCTVSLTEELFATIRGVDFYHQRSGYISARAYEDCLGL